MGSGCSGRNTKEYTLQTAILPLSHFLCGYKLLVAGGDDLNLPTLELPQRDDQLAVTPPDLKARAPVRGFVALQKQRDKRGVVRHLTMPGAVTPGVVSPRVVASIFM